MQIFRCELVEAVAVAAGIEHVGHEHRVVDRRELEPAFGEHEAIDFRIVHDLEHARRFEEWCEAREYVAFAQLPRHQVAAEEIARAFAAMGERRVPRAPGRGCERKPDEIALHRIDRRRLGVERDDAALVCRGDHLVERVEIGDRAIGRAVDLLRDRRFGARRGKRLRAALEHDFGGLVGGAGSRARERGFRWSGCAQCRGIDLHAVAAAPSGAPDQRRLRLDRIRVDGIDLRRAFRQRREFERLGE